MSSRNLLTTTLFLTALGFQACGSNETKPANTETAKHETTSAPQAEAPKAAEKPKAEAPQAEAQKPATPPAETPKETPKVETPKPAPSGDAAIDTMRAFIGTLKLDKSAPGWKTKVTEPPKLTFEAGHKYFWVLNTSEGVIKVRLMPDVAPMHVSSTIYLTELGFYDDLLFHRVIPGFMAQGGDPTGTGGGGPAYRMDGEFAANALHSKPGILSTANTGQPKSDGSQFFLTFAPTPHLNGKHTVFGEVVEGMDTVKKLESFGSQGGPTQKPLKIVTAKITTE
jgi:peptidyl-prolyl cis-trans isomerase B (cyclophilin B)